MKRVASRFARGFLGICVVLLVLSAVFVGVARELVYQIDEFRPEIIEFINERSDLHVNFAAIEGSWTGLAPRVAVHNVTVRLKQATSDPLHIATVDLEFMLLHSLVNLSPRVRLQLDGAEGQAHFQENHLRLSGFDVERKPSPVDNSGKVNGLARLETLMDQPRIELANSKLTVSGLLPEPVSLQVHQLRSEAGSRRRYLLGDFTASGPSDIHFTLKGRVRGNVFSQDSLDGGLYMHVDQGDWLDWIPLKQRSFDNAKITSLKGGASVWLNISAGQVKELVSQFNINGLNLSSSGDIKPPEIINLQGKARWGLLGENDWRLDLEEIRMQTNRFLWLPSVFSLRSKHLDERRTRYQFKLDDVDMEPWVNYYLAIEAPEDKVHKILKKLRPAGKLQDVAVELIVAEKKVEDYRFALRVNEMQNRPWKFIPGFYDLEFRAWGNRDVTLFKVDDTYLEMNYPRLFRDLIVANHVDAGLKLSNLEDRWLLQSDTISVNSSDVQSATQLSLELPKDKAEPPFLQLQATLRNGDGAQTSLYLPSGIIKEPLLEWLDQFIVDGRLLRGDIVVHGPARLNQIEPLGVLLGFTAEQATLQFLPQWKEPVRGAIGDVVIDQGAVDAQVIAGEYYGQSVTSAEVTLPRRQEDEALTLSVRARGYGQAEHGFAILTDSPLRQFLGDFISDISVKGDMEVGFGLDVPLQENLTEQLSGSTDILVKKGTFNLASQDLTISDVTAEVNFDLKKGLSARSITGKFLDGRISGNINTRKKGDAASVAINLKGNTSVAALSAWRTLPLLPMMTGPLHYSGRLTVPLSQPESRAVPELYLSSQLQQVQVDLPAPFGKSAGTPQLFDMTLAVGDEPRALSLRYGDLVNMVLLLGEDGIRRGAVQFGDGRAIMPQSNVLSVSGILSRFDDREWHELVQSNAGMDSSSNVIADQSQPEAVSVGLQDTLFSKLDDCSVRVEALTLAGKEMGQTDLRLLKAERYWTLWVANELVSGKVELPSYLVGPVSQFHRQAVPLKIDLDYLRLPPNDDAENKPDPEDWQPIDLSPSILPPVQVTVDSLTVGEGDFGTWTFDVIPDVNGVTVPDLQASVAGVALRGKVQWLEEAGATRRTTFQGKVTAANAADAIRALGGTPTLSSKSADVSGLLIWPGAPFEFALNRLQGDLSLRLKDGVFYNVSSNAAGKLWGALNFETFMRRLQLDFDDIKESEMVYDEISGNVRMNRGVLDLSRFKLNSPAIKMHAEGKVDIDHKALDVGLDVAVPVARNLLLPAAVFGGVPGAATAFVVERMFGEQFDKLTTIKYAITGSFDEPKVEVKDSFSIIPKQVGEAVMRNEKSGAGADNGAEKQPKVEVEP